MKQEGSNLTTWFVSTGALALWAGITDMLQRWRYELFEARLCDVLIVASGVLLLGAGLWRALSKAGSSAAVWTGAVGAAAFALTLFGGMWSGAIPCSGAG
jgi:hypothetical protein